MMRVPMLLFVAASIAASGADIHGRVVTVKDGDTITVETSDRKIITVRIAAIDAPELKQAFGQQARATLRTLIIDKTIQVQWNKRDRDQRVVGKINVGIRDIGLELIRGGAAWHANHYMREQSSKDRALYSEAEVDARRGRRGLWAGTTPIPPWEFRSTRRPKR